MRCAPSTDGYLAIRHIAEWKKSLMKQTGQTEEAFQLQREGANADLRLVAIPWKDSIEELHDREDSAIWKVQEVPSVRWFYNVNLNQLSAIDVRQNSFKVNAEITIFRQMLSCELRLYVLCRLNALSLSVLRTQGGWRIRSDSMTAI